MGTVTILDYTTKEPLEMIGKMAGVCYGSNIEDKEKNIKRGRKNLESGHMRCAEFPQVYMIIEGFSARVLRELYTHIGGSPTRLQASTRYIDYAEKGIPSIVPPSISASQNEEIYNETLDKISNASWYLEKSGIPKEDVANLFPLGMESKMVFRTNLRHLIEMSHQRMCSRAYWEFQDLFSAITAQLMLYSPQWAEVAYKYFKPKCEVCGFCTEKHGCGTMPSKKELRDILVKQIQNMDTSRDKKVLEAFAEAIT